MRTPHDSRRAAFTLVELLVVIAIIAILGSLASVAVFRWIDRQRERNTEALIKAVDETLMKHWSKVIDEAKNETIPDLIVALSGGSRDRARIVWIKLRLTEAFPMSYYEVNVPPMFYDHTGLVQKGSWIPLIPLDRRKYFKTYQGKINNLGNAVDRNTESAACLLAALSVSRGAAAPLNFDQLPVPPRDTDGDGVKELVDGLDHTVDFFRFPTYHPGLQAANPAPKDPKGNPTLGDTLDPVTLKTNPPPYYFQLTDKNVSGWWNGPGRIIFQEVCRYSLVDPTTSSQPTPSNLYYTIPVIVSRGLDGRSGLKNVESVAPAGVPLSAPSAPRPTWHSYSTPYGDYPDMSILNAADEKDNIYSFTLRAPQ